MFSVAHFQIPAPEIVPDPIRPRGYQCWRAPHGTEADREFAKYAESASKRALAGKAMANVHEKFAKIPGKKEVPPRED